MISIQLDIEFTPMSVNYQLISIIEGMAHSMNELIIQKKEFQIVMHVWLITMQPSLGFAWKSLWLVINMLGIWKVHNIHNSGSLFSIASYYLLSGNLLMLWKSFSTIFLLYYEELLGFFILSIMRIFPRVHLVLWMNYCVWLKC